MRKWIGGLLGLCLMAALVPDASARTDARASAHASSHSRPASRQAAARPAAARPSATRSANARSARPVSNTRSAARSARPAASTRTAVSARRGDRGRATAARFTAPSRLAVAERSGRRGRDSVVVMRGRGRVHGLIASRGRDFYVSARGNRGMNTRMAAAVPYGRSASYAIPAGRGLRRTAMASCTFRHGRRSCGATASTASRSDSMGGWTGGLAPAAMSQLACPDGTIATMAIGHNNITRCVPL